jgi:hypothetical protein
MAQVLRGWSSPRSAQPRSTPSVTSMASTVARMAAGTGTRPATKNIWQSRPRAVTYSTRLRIARSRAALIAGQAGRWLLRCIVAFRPCRLCPRGGSQPAALMAGYTLCNRNTEADNHDARSMTGNSGGRQEHLIGAQQPCQGSKTPEQCPIGPKHVRWFARTEHTLGRRYCWQTTLRGEASTHQGHTSQPMWGCKDFLRDETALLWGADRPKLSSPAEWSECAAGHASASRRSAAWRPHNQKAAT